VKPEVWATGREGRRLHSEPVAPDRIVDDCWMRAANQRRTKIIQAGVVRVGIGKKILADSKDILHLPEAACDVGRAVRTHDVGVDSRIVRKYDEVLRVCECVCGVRGGRNPPIEVLALAQNVSVVTLPEPVPELSMYSPLYVPVPGKLGRVDQVSCADEHDIPDIPPVESQSG